VHLWILLHHHKRIDPFLIIKASTNSGSYTAKALEGLYIYINPFMRDPSSYRLRISLALYDILKHLTVLRTFITDFMEK